MMLEVRKSSPKSVKIYCWVSCSAAALHFIFGPSSPNNGRDVLKKISEEAERTGKPTSEIADEVGRVSHTFKVIHKNSTL